MSIKLEQKYRFLGNTVPSYLRFKEQVETTTTKCRRRDRVLKCMKTKSWGNLLETQRMIYLVFCWTALEYNAPAWHPWISDTKERVCKGYRTCDARRRLLEKKRNVRLTTRLGWRLMAQNIQPMNYRVKELRPPLERNQTSVRGG